MLPQPMGAHRLMCRSSILQFSGLGPSSRVVRGRLRGTPLIWRRSHYWEGCTKTKDTSGNVKLNWAECI
jgi:hypothetical protein